MINLHSQIVVSRKFTDEYGHHDVNFFAENYEKVNVCQVFSFKGLSDQPLVDLTKDLDLNYGPY